MKGKKKGKGVKKRVKGYSQNTASKSLSKKGKRLGEEIKKNRGEPRHEELDGEGRN